MNFSASSIFASFIFSVAGLALFREARRRDNRVVMLTGFALMSYSYFTNSPSLDWGIGLGLCALSYYFWV